MIVGYEGPLESSRKEPTIVDSSDEEAKGAADIDSSDEEETEGVE